MFKFIKNLRKKKIEFCKKTLPCGCVIYFTQIDGFLIQESESKIQSEAMSFYQNRVSGNGKNYQVIESKTV